jgi:mercuric ion transport protein
VTQRATGDNAAPALGYLSLFTSIGTLLCCALPSLLVLFGLGATVATVLSAAPWLVVVSRHKHWVFALSGALIAGNFVYIYKLAPAFRRERAACPVEAPEACNAAIRISRIVLWLSAALYVIGFMTAYVLGPVLIRLES